jgi:hypothetical protein
MADQHEVPTTVRFIPLWARRRGGGSGFPSFSDTIKRVGDVYHPYTRTKTRWRSTRFNTLKNCRD